MTLTTRSFAFALALSLGGPTSAQEFAPLGGFERVRGALAIAADPRGGRVAVGTRSSVWIGAPGAPALRALRAGEVRDLAFGADGALWVGSERGLVRFAEGVATPHALGPGASGSATRLAWLGDTLAIGTEDGLALRAPDGTIARANGEAPEGAVRALLAGDRELFAVVGAEIARFTLAANARSIASAAREELPAGDGAALDLARLPSGEILALRERGLARRSLASWERVPLALPPGATPTRIAASARGVFVATESGVLFAPRADAAFERLAAPAGRAHVAALALGADTLHLAGANGVLHGALRAALPAAHDALPGSWAAAPREPSVLAVQRAALRYLAVEPSRSAGLATRARRSALAPVLELFGGVAQARSRDFDWDETFTSGLDRTFFDRHQERARDFDAGARLSWNFGGVVYHPEEIDASRERREWLELRDEVLDEIAQLYFERRRVLLDRARERDPHLAARLALRADELAAGLDAWTGGWWSRQLASLSPRGPEPREITP